MGILAKNFTIICIIMCAFAILFLELVTETRDAEHRRTPSIFMSNQ